MTAPVFTGALAYIAGQIFNFAFQLLLLRALGAQGYGHVGLAHISFTALMFVCDLGYGLYFLREQPHTERWNNKWRSALGHRLLATLLSFSALTAFWVARYGSTDQGLVYLLAVAPATLLALINFSSPLLAAGRHNAGFAMQQIAWPAAAICFTLTWSLQGPTLPPELLAGGCVSIGYLIQALFNLAVMRGLSRKTTIGARLSTLLTPSFSRGGWRMLKASLTLSLLGFLGMANERLTAFLIEGTAIGFLPAYLLLGQMLGGASGILGQFNRLLVAQEANGRNAAYPVRAMTALLLASMALLLLAIAISCDKGCWKVPSAWLQLGLPVLLDWTLSALGGSMAAILVGRHQEKKLARAVVFGVALSIMTQLAGAWFNSADTVLWARVAGAAAGLFITARLSGIAVPVSLPLFCMAVALGSISQAHLLPWPVPAAASLIVLLLVLRFDSAPIRLAFSSLIPTPDNYAAGLAETPQNLARQTATTCDTAQLNGSDPETGG
ncbi:hypothetical protein [Methylomonas methanica]|uniref:Polysaccharide biosynthesis protein n=1 Tax=Methylomonas methanica (strain DSM 25384 / MC09) TaxID=857087 RepID=F9ZW41_METMM|nr:hypothetical protein [Methylomonas methanica]AEG02012.1 hypothetical protein Metme_3651 [Methylomonas methanica MC09]